MLNVTGSNTTERNIRTVPRMGTLSVYHLHPETTENELKNYLTHSAANITFNVKLLKTNEHQSAFKVSFPLEYVDQVYKSEIWPQGATVRRFVFRKGNSFFPKGHRHPASKLQGDQN